MASLISVIIPCYNEERFIGQTLDSVIAQNHPNMEVIVIDDGSTDNTAKIVKKYIDNTSNIRYVFQENNGVSAARNNGIKSSNGEFIIFLDADDSYKDNDSLSKMSMEIEESESDMVYCGYLERRGDSLKTISTDFTRQRVLEKYLFGKIKAQTNCWIYRKTFLQNQSIQFNKKLKIGEDIHFIALALSKTNSISFVSENLIIYNLDESESGLGVINFKKLDRDVLFFNTLLQEKSISNNLGVKKIILQYKLPAHLVNTLLELYKLNEDKSQIIDSYSKYSPLIAFSNSFMFKSAYYKLVVKRVYLYLVVKQLIRRKK